MAVEYTGEYSVHVDGNTAQKKRATRAASHFIWIESKTGKAYDLRITDLDRKFQPFSKWRGEVKCKLLTSLLAAGLLMAGVPVSAHHGTGVSYVTDKEVSLKGTVTEWIWSNPHCGILFDVTDENGQVAHWGAELGNPHSLSLAGMSKDTLKPGDKVTIMGHPARSGAPRLELKSIVLADGRVLPEKGVKGNGEHVDEPGK